jgi:hypothetical protein
MGIAGDWPAPRPPPPIPAAIRFRFSRDFRFRELRGGWRPIVLPTTRLSASHPIFGRAQEHPKDETIAQYCALDVPTAMAEMVRHEIFREPREARELRTKISGSSDSTKVRSSTTRTRNSQQNEDSHGTYLSMTIGAHASKRPADSRHRWAGQFRFR